MIWKNADDSPHRIADDDGGYASAALDTDDSYSHTFATPGVYNYICSIHPYMVGKIVVKPAGTGRKPGGHDARASRSPRPEFREVIAAWLVCLAVAAGCLTLLAATAAERGGGSAALINPERIEVGRHRPSPAEP